MSLENNFKNDLTMLLNQYEKDNDAISVEEAQAITSIRIWIAEINSLIKIRQDILNLTERLTSKFFAFLPFVFDLKKELRNFLNEPQYSLMQIVTYEATVLREENIQLKSKLGQLESVSQHNHVYQSATDNVLSQRIALLEKDFFQSNQLLRNENKQLLLQLNQAQHKNSQLLESIDKLQTKVVNAEARVARLENDLKDKQMEIERLRAENTLLKKEQPAELNINKGISFW